MITSEGDSNKKSLKEAAMALFDAYGVTFDNIETKPIYSAITKAYIQEDIIIFGRKISYSNRRDLSEGIFR